LAILIVDDNEDNVVLIRTTLEEEGHETLIAYDGPTAVELATSKEPELILLDIMMPGMDGFDTLCKIKENERISSIPVIMVTAKVDGGSVKEAFQRGAYDYIKKPVDELELMARVNSALKLHEANQLLKSKNRELERSNRELQLYVEDLEKQNSNLKGGKAGSADASGKASLSNGALTSLLDPGESYIFSSETGGAAQAFDVISLLAASGKRGLCITRQFPRNLQKRYSLGECDLVWLTTSMPEGEVDYIPPDRLARIAILIDGFISTNPGSVVLLEGVEFLLHHNNYRSIMNLLQVLKDKMMMAEGILLVTADEASIDAEDYKKIASEFRGFDVNRALERPLR